jgi:pimeloyl-ACP methyl ester carboxylesterase
LLSRYEAIVFHEEARARNIRIIAPDRPGVGHSDFQPNRTLADWPADVVALADAPEIAAKQFAVLGVSAGGAYVLSCCHGLPKERLLAAAVVCGVMPSSLGQKGMDFGLWLMFTMAQWSTALLGWLLNFAVAKPAQMGKEQIVEAMGKSNTGWPEVDRTAWATNEKGVRDWLPEGIQGGVVEPKTGTKGQAWDAYILGGAWPFRLEDVRMEKGKLVLWHGTLDQSCPYATTVKGTGLLDASELRICEGQAHITTALRNIDDVLDTLKGRAS